MREPSPVGTGATVALPIPGTKPAPPRAGRPGGGRFVWARTSVYVRARPDGDAGIVDGLLPGDRLERMASAGDPDGWTRVARNGRPFGWVASRFLSDRPPPPRPEDRACVVPEDMGAPPVSVLPPGTRVRALTDAFLRAVPSCTGRVIDVLEEGEAMTVTGGGADGWYAVEGQGWPRAYVGVRLVGRAYR